MFEVRPRIPGMLKFQMVFLSSPVQLMEQCLEIRQDCSFQIFANLPFTQS
jgi:hypothetical protein